LGSYKELLDLIEAKSWRVNELVILTIHLVEVTEDVVEVLTIDIRRPFSNRRHSHIEEIKTSALWKMADSNSVYLLIGFNSGLKQDYGSKTRERKNSDTKDHSLDVASALQLVAMLSRRGVYILPNGLVVPGCRMNVRIWRTRVIKDRCLKKVDNMNIRRGDMDGRSWSLKLASCRRSVSWRVTLVPLRTGQTSGT
jgi:hypothetical protein